MARALSGNRELVFAAINAAAEDDMPCPTNLDLNRIGGGGSRFGCLTIDWLQKRGRIEVENHGNRRRIKITATGKRTAFDRSGPAEVRVFDSLPPRVNRDPCPRCGVRADIGCGHTQAPIGMSFGAI